jgi:hypothetical protein
MTQLDKKNEFKINMNIPGQMSPSEIEALCALAQSVRSPGIVVELGSLCGLSAWHWSKNVGSHVQIFCVDPWVRARWIVEHLEKPFKTGPFGKHLFDRYTNDCNNIIPIQGYSPDVLQNWALPINIFFDDAVHSNPGLKRNILFWNRFVIPGGYACGHDYSRDWPDVISEADELAAAWGGRVETCETFWWVQRPA